MDPPITADDLRVHQVGKASVTSHPGSAATGTSVRYASGAIGEAGGPVSVRTCCTVSRWRRRAGGDIDQRRRDEPRR
jgi:hypothetical protein